MKMLLAGLALALAGCAAVPLDYSGKDAGAVVIGFGVAKEPKAYDVYRLVIARADDAAGCLKARTANLVDFSSYSLLTAHRDYVHADETGVVLTATLMPGDYAICDYQLTYQAAEVPYVLSPGRTFRLPFTVQSGKTVYLGNLQANTLMGRGLKEGVEMPAGVAFVVTDRLPQDMALASAARPGLPTEVINGTLDVQANRAPSFWSPQMIQELR